MNLEGLVSYLTKYKMGVYARIEVYLSESPVRHDGVDGGALMLLVIGDEMLNSRRNTLRL